MPDMTIQDLATKSKREVEDLLEIVKGAGLSQQHADDPLSAGDRKVLIRALAGSAAPPPQSARRRTTSMTVKRGGAKATKVDVKVRKRLGQPSPEAPVAPAAEQGPQSAQRTGDAPPGELAASVAAQSPGDANLASVAPEPVAEGLVGGLVDVPSSRLNEAKPFARVAPKDGRDKSRKPAGAKPAAPPHRPARPAAKRRSRGADDKTAFNPGQLARPDDPLDDVRPPPASKERRRMAPAAVPKQIAAHQFKRPAAAVIRDIKLPPQITVMELSRRMATKTPAVLRALGELGESAEPEDVLERDVATLLVEALGHKPQAVDVVSAEAELDEALERAASAAETLPRPPVVTLMGHVDHGKTSILDRIRESRVAEGEAGGITQHMGAYHVRTPNGALTFLDTPGHAAFTQMRARGSQITDVVVLVVAADDGVMPQTEEAVRHVQAAGVPIVVAVNKIDKENADPDRVKNELAKLGVVYDSWGGNTQFAELSATEGTGLDGLLEAVLLEAEVMELSAPRDAPARGVVVEARIDKHRGVVAHLLVQSGTLRVGDIVLSGTEFGRLRSMSNDAEPKLKAATPAMLVEALGMSGVPVVGERFSVVPRERVARAVADERALLRRAASSGAALAAPPVPQSLEEAFEQLERGESKMFNMVLKADVLGSVEAVRSALESLGNDEVKVQVLMSGVGGVNESDVHFAAASEATVIAFNVRADATTRRLIDGVGVDVRYYQLIYEVIEDVELALSDMLGVEQREEVVASAAVRDVFRSQQFGQIAGCVVTEGTVRVGQSVRVLRDNAVVFTGEIDSLRRFKEAVKEVASGVECGIGVKNYTNVRVADQLEIFTLREVARKL